MQPIILKAIGQNHAIVAANNPVAASDEDSLHRIESLENAIATLMKTVTQKRSAELTSAFALLLEYVDTLEKKTAAQSPACGLSALDIFPTGTLTLATSPLSNTSASSGSC